MQNVVFPYGCVISRLARLDILALSRSWCTAVGEEIGGRFWYRELPLLQVHKSEISARPKADLVLLATLLLWHLTINRPRCETSSKAAH